MHQEEYRVFRLEDLRLPRIKNYWFSISGSYYLVIGYGATNQCFKNPQIFLYHTLEDRWYNFNKDINLSTSLHLVPIEGGWYVLDMNTNQPYQFKINHSMLDIRVLKPTPEFISFPMIEYVPGKGVYILGSDNSEKIWLYDFEKDNYYRIGILEYPITSGASVYLEGKIYLIGGFVYGDPSFDITILDTNTHKLTQGDKFIRPLSGHRVTLLNRFDGSKNILITGNYLENSLHTQVLIEIDPSSLKSFCDYETFLPATKNVGYNHKDEYTYFLDGETHLLTKIY